MYFPPFTLIDYFPDDFLIIVDESHITLPQVRGMFAGDRSRKTTLVDYLQFVDVVLQHQQDQQQVYLG